MDENFALEPRAIQMHIAAQELRELNGLTGRFGLYLSEPQIEGLISRRFSALKDTGRVEFGGGILKKLIRAFCDSPYISQENYEDTITELQDSFYYFKNESGDSISDDDLIEFMKRVFDGKAQGSIDYLIGTSLEELCRDARNDYDDGEADACGEMF